jgi:fibro-slime domain-containing protein
MLKSNTLFFSALVAGLSLACSAGEDGGSSLDGNGNGNGNGSGGTNGGIDVGTGGGGIDVGGGNTGNTGNVTPGSIKAIIRDFSKTFPDMEPCANVAGKTCNSTDPGIAGNELDAEFRPVYAGPANGTVTTAGNDPKCGGKPCFHWWYRDAEQYNKRTEIELKFEDQGNSLYVFDNQEFFPIDNVLVGNEGLPHNYYFTFEILTQFTYVPGQTFTFIGDDDVFVFINNKKVIDIGGIHGPLKASVQLDTLGLTPDQKYPLHFFGAERHPTGSTFRIETTIKEFIEPPPQ